MFKFFKKLFNRHIDKKIGLCGAQPSPKDDRDIIKNIVQEDSEYIKSPLAGDINISSLLKEYSLENKLGKILDQKSTNACTGFSAVYLMNILMSKTLEESNYKHYNLNPFFCYYWARYFSDLDVNKDEGAYLRSSLKGLNKKGVWSCDTMKDPLSKIPNDFNSEISFKLMGYEKIDLDNNYNNSSSIINKLKVILSKEELPLYCCVKILEDKIDSWTGKFYLPDNNMKSGGWHAMTVVGYKVDNKNITWFKTANSWGTSWGDKGYAWIHEGYFKDSDLICEAWSPIIEYY